jgi:hypothetical protein
MFFEVLDRGKCPRSEGVCNVLENALVDADAKFGQELHEREMLLGNFGDGLG